MIRELNQGASMKTTLAPPMHYTHLRITTIDKINCMSAIRIFVCVYRYEYQQTSMLTQMFVAFGC